MMKSTASCAAAFGIYLMMFSVSAPPANAAPVQAAPANSAHAGDAPRPNIVLIMADDLGFSDVGCYGGEINTPHLDALAERGLRFTQFYNCARCNPTRESLLTGLYPQQADGVHSVTLAEVLRGAGYRTLMTGKWHGYSGLPTERGFDRYFGVISGSCNFFNPGDRRPGEPAPAKDHDFVRPFARDGKVIKPFTPSDKNWYATDAFTDQAIAYLDEYAADDRPFFLYLAYTAPHHPLQAPEDEIAKYRGKYRLGWDALREQRWKRQQSLGLAAENWKLSPRDEAAEAWDVVQNKDDWDLAMAVYAAMVDRMDQHIGRLLEKLRALGIEENTLVIFLSDNGACAEINNQTPDIPPGPMESYRTYDLAWANAGDTPLRKFKRWTYEGGICTPLIVRWPAAIKQHGAIRREPGHVFDLMPTFCDLAGATYPASYHGEDVTPTEGKSLLPLLLDGKRVPHASLCWEHLGSKAVRQGSWKLVGSGDPARLENWALFDLAADRCETHDLSGEHPQRVRQLAEAWITWAKRTGWTPRRNRAEVPEESPNKSSRQPVCPLDENLK
ncbi:MAG: arylsulfatase [Pirellulaceae bacterium]